MFIAILHAFALTQSYPSFRIFTFGALSLFTAMAGLVISSTIILVLSIG